MPNEPLTSSRRRVLQVLAGLGIGTTVSQRSLAPQVGPAGKVTAEMIANAQLVAGLELSEAEQKAAADALNRDQSRYATLRKAEVGYDVPPALHFYAESSPT